MAGADGPQQGPDNDRDEDRPENRDRIAFQAGTQHTYGDRSESSSVQLTHHAGQRRKRRPVISEG